MATLGSALLVSVIPIALLIVFFLLVGMGWGGAINGVLPWAATAFLIVVLLLAALMVGSLAVQGAMVRALVAHVQGERVLLRGCLGGSFGKVLPLFGLSMMMTLGMAIGFVALFIPAIIAAIMWSVAAPALVAENLGIFAALRRSQELTAGNRWKIFGLMALTWVFYSLASSVFEQISSLVGGIGGSDSRFFNGLDVFASFTGGLLSLTMWTIYIAFWGALSASLYLELRTSKEGPLTNDLAEVFA